MATDPNRTVELPSGITLTGEGAQNYGKPAGGAPVAPAPQKPPTPAGATPPPTAPVPPPAAKPTVVPSYFWYEWHRCADIPTSAQRAT